MADALKYFNTKSLQGSLSGNLRFLGLLTLLLLGFYELFRIIFFIYNFQEFDSFSLFSFSKVMLTGFRYDLSAILLLNTPVVIWALISSQKMMFSRLSLCMLWVYGFGMNCIFFMFNLVDVEFVHFTGRRLTRDIFNVSQDIQTEAMESILDYWYMSALTIGLWLIFGYLFVWVIKHSQASTVPEGSRKGWGAQIGLRIVIFVLSVVAMRGGLQLKPLNTVQAFSLGSEMKALMALNSTFSILKSGSKRQLTKLNWLSPQDYENILPGGGWRGSGESVPQIKNVVVVVLESFSLEYTGIGNSYSGYTPFLNELAKKSLSFQHAFANGRRSIEAIPSLLCAIPSLMRDAFITSQYQANRIHCLPEQLKRLGWETSFFHGAKNGTMYFDSFAERVGFDHYYGLSEYPNSADFDGVWGIYDEPYVNYVAEEIGGSEKPFFSLIFTLSSHHPYSIPAEHMGKFPKGTLEIHESIGYADYALMKFFEKIKGKKWYGETLFVLTADHTQKTDQAKYANRLGRYRVPLLFYHPKQKVLDQLRTSVNSDQLVQHVDLFPTLNFLLGVNSKSTSAYGRNIFNQQTLPVVYNGSDEQYWWLSENGMFLMNGMDGDPVYFTLGEDLGLIPSSKNVLPSYERDRALWVKQSFNLNMTGNSLVWSHSSKKPAKQ